MVNSCHGYNPDFFKQVNAQRRLCDQTEYMRQYNARKRDERARREGRELPSRTLIREQARAREATLIRRLVSIPAPSLEVVIQRVLDWLNVPMEDIVNKQERKALATDAVRIISYFGFKITTAAEVGRALSRNHGSILGHVSSMPKVAMKRHQIELQPLR